MKKINKKILIKKIEKLKSNDDNLIIPNKKFDRNFEILLKRSMRLNYKMLRQMKEHFWTSIVLHILWFLLGMFWGARLLC